MLARPARRTIPLLGPHDPFPPVNEALEEPDGLLAAGADLSVPRLIDAYAHGIFPWFNAGDPSCGGRPIRARCWRRATFTSPIRCESACGSPTSGHDRHDLRAHPERVRGAAEQRARHLADPVDADRLSHAASARSRAFGGSVERRGARRGALRRGARPHFLRRVDVLAPARRLQDCAGLSRRAARPMGLPADRLSAGNRAFAVAWRRPISRDVFVRDVDQLVRLPSTPVRWQFDADLRIGSSPRSQRRSAARGPATAALGASPERREAASQEAAARACTIGSWLSRSSRERFSRAPAPTTGRTRLRCGGS